MQGKKFLILYMAAVVVLLAVYLSTGTIESLFKSNGINLGTAPQVNMSATSNAPYFSEGQYVAMLGSGGNYALQSENGSAASAQINNETGGPGAEALFINNITEFTTADYAVQGAFTAKGGVEAVFQTSKPQLLYDFYLNSTAYASGGNKVTSVVPNQKFDGITYTTFVVSSENQALYTFVGWGNGYVVLYTQSPDQFNSDQVATFVSRDVSQK